MNAELARRSGQQGVNTALAQRKQKPCTTTKELFTDTSRSEQIHQPLQAGITAQFPL